MNVCVCILLKFSFKVIFLTFREQQKSYNNIFVRDKMSFNSKFKILFAN